LDWLRRLGLAQRRRHLPRKKNQHHRQSYERAGANFFPRESAINMNCVAEQRRHNHSSDDKYDRVL